MASNAKKVARTDGGGDKDGKDKNDKKIVVLKQREQILLRPNVIIGNVVPSLVKDFVPTSDGIVCVDEPVSTGLLKIVEEVVANARDASIGDPNATGIHVNVLSKTGEVSVKSLTRFDIEWNSELNDWNVAIAFSVLNSSSNFTDDPNSFVVGQNGLGVKAANIFSKIFSVIVCNLTTRKVYVGKWADNMNKVLVSKAVSIEDAIKQKLLTASEAKANFVKVTFKPDYARFSTPLPLSDAVTAMIGEMAFNAAITTPPYTNVFLNNSKIKANTIASYIKKMMGDDVGKIMYDSVKDKDDNLLFEIGLTFVPEASSYGDNVDDDDSAAPSDSSCVFAKQVVFVNGAKTTSGTVQSEVLKLVAAHLSKKKIKVSPSALKASLFLVANLPRFPNPRFSNQLKDELVSPMKDAVKWTPPPEFLKKVEKAGADLLQIIKEEQEDKDDKKAKKQVAPGRGLKIPKYEPALGIGKKGVEPSLILTEGDSAKAFVVAGVSGLSNGREKYGIFPLRGKLLNVAKAASLAAALKNVEISNIFKMTGIVPKKKYDATTIKALPYRHVVIATDQDTDGAHILGLVMLVFQHFAKSVLEVWPDFIQRFPTPVVRIVEGKFADKEFFSEPEYEKFISDNPTARKASVKYYKGLGTSTATDAKRHFKNADQLLTTVKYTGARSDDAMALAFGSKKEGGRDLMVEARRAFLVNEFDNEAFIDYRKTEVTFEEIVEKEVFRFFDADNLRSIPSACDGLKPSLRKVVHVALSSRGEINVARFASEVARQTSYHHGEASLHMAVKGMAATYTGSGNVSYLTPSGQFGTRHLAGKDAAAPRYIQTGVDSVTPFLFRLEDLPLLRKEIDDDKKEVQPIYFVPVIATALLNSSTGVGTGFSSDLPSYNPLDLIAAARSLAKDIPVNETSLPLLPYGAGWKGKILPTSGGYFSVGMFTLESPRRLRVTELPLGVGTEDWLASISTPPKSDDGDKKAGKAAAGKAADGAGAYSFIKDIVSKNSNDTVDITLTLTKDVVENDVVKLFKLAKKISTTNMHCLDISQTIRLFDNVYDILSYHGKVRLNLYGKRRLHLIDVNEKKLAVLNAKIRYVILVIDGQIKLGQYTTAELSDKLIELGFNKVDNSFGFLTSIPTGSLVKDNVEKMRKEAEQVEQRIADLRGTTPAAMWLGELDELEVAVKEYNVRRAAIVSGEEVSKKKKRKE